jgi:hypothetical protein
MYYASPRKTSFVSGVPPPGMSGMVRVEITVTSVSGTFARAPVGF